MAEASSRTTRCDNVCKGINPNSFVTSKTICRYFYTPTSGYPHPPEPLDFVGTVNFTSYGSLVSEHYIRPFFSCDIQRPQTLIHKVINNFTKTLNSISLYFFKFYSIYINFTARLSWISVISRASANIIESKYFNLFSLSQVTGVSLNKRSFALLRIWETNC